MNILYSEKVKELMEIPIPKSMSEEWIPYLLKCSDCIHNKEHGYWFLKRKLMKAGYGIAKDGTVCPF